MNVARNDPCPCGSGKKFKKCCMEATPEQQLANLGPPDTRAKKLMELTETDAGRRALEKTAATAALGLAEQVNPDRPLLAVDEWVWLAAKLQTPLERLAEVDPQHRDAEAKTGLVDALEKLLDKPLIDAVIARARTLSTESAADPKLAAWYRNAALMLEVFPTPLFYAALVKIAVVCVTELEEEDVHVNAMLEQRTWTKASLEPYRKFLADRGEPQAAERIANAQAALAPA